jgi:hypothetical protein
MFPQINDSDELLSEIICLCYMFFPKKGFFMSIKINWHHAVTSVLEGTERKTL